MVDRVGQQLGHYRLLRVLGQGSFAAVYLGEHQYLERPAAIKVLHVRMEPGKQEAFRREARTIAQLSHPHIIGVHDFGIEDQTPYLAMEYTPNGTLRARHPSGSRLSFEQIIGYVKQIASALDYAHTQYVIHRDVKPENILLNAKHELVLSDFGLAVAQPLLNSLSTQNLAGTPLYMAPEQIRGKPCAASDQYALGVIVYEWLCGEVPFRGTLYEVLDQHLNAPPPGLCERLPQLPQAAEDAVLGALAKDPQHRFPTVQDFATVLSETFFATQSLALNGSFEHRIRDEVTHFVSTSEPSEQDSTDGVSQPRLKVVKSAEEKPEQILSTSSQLPMPGQTTSKTVRSSLAQTNRQRLLRRVRSFWITGVLEQSLHGAALMALGLEKQPDAVANPWHLVVQQPDTAPCSLPEGTRITQVYDDADGELLILGAPGAGKTTLLLELARDLLERAEQDEQHPMPVLFNLSSWAMKPQSLVDWLIEELSTKYQVPRKLGQALVTTDQILPLLDGLDEVATKDRGACIEAINAYRQEHGLLPLAVCSRSADYLAQTTRVLLRSAVVVQPLSGQQIENYLRSAGPQVEALLMALRQDSDLQELATTPLMLNLLLLAYQGMSRQEIAPLGTLLAKQQQVFATYVQRMLHRQGTQDNYTSQQTMHWLAYLARQMKQENQTEFYIEGIQPSWLEKSGVRRLYFTLITGFLGALFAALIAGIVSGILSTWTSYLLRWVLSEYSPQKWHSSDLMYIWGHWLFSRVLPNLYSVLSTAIGGLLVGLVGGLLVGLAGGLLVGLLNIRETKIKPLGVIIWSWETLSRDVVVSLLIGCLCIFLIGCGFLTGLVGNPVGVLITREVSTQSVAVVAICPPGSCTTAIPAPSSPSALKEFQSVLKSLLSSQLISGVIFGFVGGLVSGFLGGKRNDYCLEVTRYTKLKPILIGVIVGLVDWLIGLQLATSLSVVLDNPLGGLLHWSVSEPSKPWGIVVGGLLGVVLCSLVGGLTFGLINGFSGRELEKHLLVVPNQGIRRSACTGLRTGLLVGLMCLPFCIGLLWPYAWITSTIDVLILGLFTWFFFAPFVGLFIGLLCGGVAVIKHMLLRFFLYRVGHAPWNYPRFLDYAAERILLRKVGGGYIFVHRLLLEYFASLDTTSLPDNTRI